MADSTDIENTEEEFELLNVSPPTLSCIFHRAHSKDNPNRLDLSTLDEVCTESLHNNFDEIINNFRCSDYVIHYYLEADIMPFIHKVSNPKKGYASSHMISSLLFEPATKFLFLLLHTRQIKLYNLLNPPEKYITCYNETLEFLKQNPDYKRDLLPIERMEIDKLQRKINRAKHFKAKLVRQSDKKYSLKIDDSSYGEYINNTLKRDYIDVEKMLDYLREKCTHLRFLENIPWTKISSEDQVTLLDYTTSINWNSLKICLSLYDFSLLNKSDITDLIYTDDNIKAYIKLLEYEFTDNIQMKLSIMFALFKFGNKKAILFYDDDYLFIPLINSIIACDYTDDMDMLQAEIAKQRLRYIRGVIKYFKITLNNTTVEIEEQL